MTRKIKLDDSVDSESHSKVESPVTKLGFVGKCVWTLASLLMGVLAITTAVTWLASWHWVADLCANLRMQQMIGLLVLLPIVACFRRWRAAGLCTVMILVHSPWFSPVWSQRAAVVHDNSSQDQDLTVMVVNVLTSNRQHERILDQIRKHDPDVFAILELGTPLHRYLQNHLPATYQDRITTPQDRGNFGIGLYSRYPLSDVDKFTLNVDTITSIAATVDKDDRSYRVVATHPLPPMGSARFDMRNDHLQLLMQRVNHYRWQNLEQPMIVMGDLNMTPWSPLFGKAISQANLKRACTGWGITPTWYAWPTYAGTRASFPFGLVLDHVLVSEHLKCSFHHVGSAIGSDHRGVVVGLKVER